MDVGSTAMSLFDTRDLRSKASCQAVGLDCGDCVQRTAQSISAICRDISTTGAYRLFSEVYPDACCGPMELVFIRAGIAPDQPIPHAVAHAA